MQASIHQREVAALSGLRGFAAMWVFIYHFWALQVYASVKVSVFGWDVDVTSAFTFGWLGVPIFFVLSGFLLAQPFVLAWQNNSKNSVFASQNNSKINLPAYFIRRILRVFPAYYGQLLILVLLAYFFQFGRYPPDAASWIAHLTMTFFSPPYFIDGINGAWWTLPIEFGFYLVLPMFAVLLKPGRGLAMLILCLCIMLSYRYAIYSVYLATDVPLYTRASLLPGVMDSFGIGMFAAYLLHHLTARSSSLTSHAAESLRGQNRLANGLMVAMLFGFCIAMLLMYWYGIFYWSGGWMSYCYTPFFSAVIACGILGASLGSSWAVLLLGNRVMRFLGEISYSLYLWHFPLIAALKLIPQLQEIGPHRNSILLGICTILLILVSWLSWRFIELPGIAFGKRLTNSLRINPKANPKPS